MKQFAGLLHSRGARPSLFFYRTSLYLDFPPSHVHTATQDQVPLAPGKLRLTRETMWVVANYRIYYNFPLSLENVGSPSEVERGS